MSNVTSGRTPATWIRIVLVLSLALNLLFVGLIAGSAWKWRSGDGPPRNVEFSMGPLGRALADQDRRALSDRLATLGGPRPPSRVEMRAATAELIALLRADPFDAAAFSSALDTVRSNALDLQAAGQQAFIAVVSNMSPEERSAFADRVESQALRGPDGDRNRKSR